ncbi:MAG TPA: cyclic pyranopterin monophosphate synthase MoaC [Alcaligenes sp.]|nr:cyclic pyranopterin monophosphate synthase MoaC [Alcaligenes sp.]HRL27934.1 cyclic pyranopterin monophosphate synthase MoaC [Alcaligenes sp.]
MSDTTTPAAAGLHLSHLDQDGKVRMVDVSDKSTTARSATARSIVRLSPAAFELLSANRNAKGEVLNTARVAGVLAAKRCAELIPMCHSLPLDFVGIDFESDAVTGTIAVLATCRTRYTTGVEMEAMTACSVAALTIYDMCKAADKGIIIEQTRLLEKTGGKSGTWTAAL